MASKVDLLFAAKAVSKEMAARVRALEDECKAELADDYMRDGTDRRRSPLFGDGAGWLSVVKRDPEPARRERRFQLTDPQAAIDWMEEARPDTDTFASENLEAFARWHFEATGELPGGCDLVEYEVPAVPAGVKSVTLTVKEKVVLPQLAGDAALLGEARRLLLGDGE